MTARPWPAHTSSPAWHALHRELTAHWHDGHDQLVVGDDHQCLEDLVVIETERVGGLPTEVVEIVTSFVLVDRVGDPCVLEFHDRWRHGSDCRTRL